MSTPELTTADKRNSRRESENESTESDLPELPVPPDGGWGWVVVFASFMIHIIADGVVYSFGIFYIEFLEYFKGGKGETSWIGSLVPGVTFATGPIASALTNKYGCRLVTCLGSVIAGTGFVLSIFAPNIVYLYFTFGIMSGFGFGLIYLPAIVSVGYYFEKKRAIATGLAVCGSGVGTFLFAPLSKWLLDMYRWKGAILIQGGLILNCVVCGLLFRPIETTASVKKKSEEDGGAKNTAEKEKLLRNGNGVSNGAAKKITKTVDDSVIEGNAQDEDAARYALENRQWMSNPHLVNGQVHKTDQGRIPKISYNSSMSVDHSRAGSPGPMYRKDVLYRGSLMNIPMYKSNPNMYAASMRSIPREEPEENDSKLFRFFHCSKEMKDSFKEMMDFSLLRDVIFLMFGFSNFFTSIGFNVPFIYLPDRARTMGIDDDRGAFLISVVGIANTVGRVIFGALSDIPIVRTYRLHLYNTALLLCGLCTALSSYCTTYNWMVAYSASYGLFIGAYVSLTSVILVDLLGLDKLTNSFGLLLLFQGLATFIGPPIAGWVFDGTGSYDVSFYIAGTMIAISGFMLYFIPCIQRCKERRKTSSAEELEETRAQELGKIIGSQEFIHERVDSEPC